MSSFIYECHLLHMNACNKKQCKSTQNLTEEMIGQKIKQTDPVLEEFLRYRQDPNVEGFTTRINHQ